MTDLMAIMADTGGAGSILGGNLVVMVLMIAGMYFLLIAPQRKRQKQHEKMIAALGSGDEILTNGGLYGTITNVKDDRFVVRVGDNTKIELHKNFIQQKIEQDK